MDEVPSFELAYPPATAIAHMVRFAQRKVELGKWPKFKVFASPKSAAVVLTRYDRLSRVRDPHIDEWRDTFREISVGELLAAISKPGFDKLGMVYPPQDGLEHHE